MNNWWVFYEQKAEISALLSSENLLIYFVSHILLKLQHIVKNILSGRCKGEKRESINQKKLGKCEKMAFFTEFWMWEQISHSLENFWIPCPPPEKNLGTSWMHEQKIEGNNFKHSRSPIHPPPKWSFKSGLWMHQEVFWNCNDCFRL